MGLAVSAVSIAPLRGIAAGSRMLDRTAPDAFAVSRFVFDERYVESVACASAAHAGGCIGRAISGDVTRFWTEDLWPLWQQARVPIAGLTDEPALFCLERLAWDYGMRVVFYTNHQRRANGTIEHRWMTSREQQRFEGGGDHWPAEMAAVLTGFRGGADSSCRPTFVMGATACSEQDPEPLVSWIIAPVSGTPVMAAPKQEVLRG